MNGSETFTLARQIMGQQAPCTATAELREDGVENFPDGVPPGPTT
jgi:hypothetical protein